MEKLAVGQVYITAESNVTIDRISDDGYVFYTEKFSEADRGISCDVTCVKFQDWVLRVGAKLQPPHEQLSTI